MCNTSVNISESEADEIMIVLCDAFTESSSLLWAEIREAISKKIRIKNWLKVRVVLQSMERAGAIYRDENIHIERYTAT